MFVCPKTKNHSIHLNDKILVFLDAPIFVGVPVNLGFYRPIILTFLLPLEFEGPSDQNLEWNFFGFWAFSPDMIGFMVCFKASVSSIFYGLSNGVYIVTIHFILSELLGVDPADPRKKYFFDPNFLTDLDRAFRWFRICNYIHMVDSKISRYLSLKKRFLCFLRIFDQKFECEILSEYNFFIYQNEALFTENMFMLSKVCFFGV